MSNLRLHDFETKTKTVAFQIPWDTKYKSSMGRRIEQLQAHFEDGSICIEDDGKEYIVISSSPGDYVVGEYTRIFFELREASLEVPTINA